MQKKLLIIALFSALDCGRKRKDADDKPADISLKSQNVAKDEDGKIDADEPKANKQRTSDIHLGPNSESVALPIGLKLDTIWGKR